MMRAVCWSAVIGLAVSTACGGEDGDGAGGGAASGIEGGKLLLDVTDDEASALCTLESEQFDAVFPSADTYCTYYASDADVPTCEEGRLVCLEGLFFEDHLGDEVDCGSATAEALVAEFDPSCEATVADYEACIRHSAQLQRAAAASASCDDAALSQAEQAEIAELENPTVCKKITNCYDSEP